MRSNRPRLLVTGFGPFPGIAHNPSAEIARRVAASPRWRRLGVAAEVMVIPTTYAALDEVLAPSLVRGAPDAVLMIGVAGRAKRVRVERRALNRASILLPDAAGRRPSRLTLADGPFTRRTAASAPRLSAVVRTRAIACSVSQDAGRYLCNAAYHQALAAAVPVVFIHVPKAPRAGDRRTTNLKRRLSWEERLADVLIEVAVQLLAGSPAPGRAL